MTEMLLSGLSDHLKELRTAGKIMTPPIKDELRLPFKHIDFVPALEHAIHRRLPDLQQPDAHQKVAEILIDLPVADTRYLTLPQMLDRLSEHFLEKQCQHPTFIINPPECLSPLAKSFVHPNTGHRVAARAELFIDATEIVNMYEEENSPVEQRRKFLDQTIHRNSTIGGDIDEAYLEALEWGLPPTGGWGGGIERLCMLLTGTSRISDVLSFGSLRHIVSLRSTIT